jgi:serine O-acetyltransferase
MNQTSEDVQAQGNKARQIPAGASEFDSIAGAFLEKSVDSSSSRGERNIPLRTGAVPSFSEMKRLMRALRILFFPGFFEARELGGRTPREQTAAVLDEIFRILVEQISVGVRFFSRDEANAPDPESAAEFASDTASEFMRRLPEIHDLLDSDVLAAYEGDPAAKSKAETIFCYPSIYAMTNHRVAHQLYKLSVPVIPRVISEMAHSRTGIDIHPGTSIGEEFFIDHGTGTVIGETSIIGSRCKLYQCVTLGALSFPKNAEGKPIKGLPRHPILEDGVTVYSGATILGRVTIGAGSIIGGNVWITSDIPPGSKVVQQHLTSAASAEDLLGKEN